MFILSAILLKGLGRLAVYTYVHSVRPAGFESLYVKRLSWKETDRKKERPAKTHDI